LKVVDYINSISILDLSYNIMNYSKLD